MNLDATVSAVVTGGASGLGAATARALAAKGVKVAIFDFNEDKGEAVASELGGVFCKVDVTSEADVDAGFAKSRAAVGIARVPGMRSRPRPATRKPVRSVTTRWKNSNGSSRSTCSVRFAASRSPPPE